MKEGAKKSTKIILWICVAACVCLLVGGIVWTIKNGPRRGDDPGQEGSSQEIAQNATEPQSEPATEVKTEEATEPKTEPATEAKTEEATEEVTEPQTEEATEAPTEEETQAPRPTYSDEEILAMIGGPNAGKVSVGAIKPKLTSANYNDNSKAYTPSVKPYTVASDLSNVTNYFYFDSEEKQKLAANRFVVTNTSCDEFHEIYENNRYGNNPNFVTTDSLMHVFHLYYVKLQKNIEKNYLYDALVRLTDGMLKKSLQQYYFFRGSEWEEAAGRNVIFFGVAAELLGSEAKVPAGLDAVVVEEVKKIMDASGIEECLITPENENGEDYTQYIPRSYYAGDEQLEAYFRTMMWYGRMIFAQNFEQGNRCALLMNVALSDESNYNEWYAIYEVTSFLCGASDDLGYNEYIPIIMQVYGVDFTLDSLVGNEAAWNRYVEAVKPLRGPKINSTPYAPGSNDSENWQEATKGFRFMGQRFVLDAQIFQNLLYDNIKMAEDGSARQLPEALDVPAALGSDLALDILIQQGNDKYPNYLEEMQKMRQVVGESDLYWTSSVYGGWLYTLMPLLEEKGAGYPSFMTNTEWQKKSMEGFLGSWTELKHDTLLYAKQAYASESGGEDYSWKDSRGYVEPEPELFDRLCTLAGAAKAGLKDMGYLSESDEEALSVLIELSGRLRDIAIKELENRTLTDEDYELIRSYGGSLEHFWDISYVGVISDEILQGYEYDKQCAEEYGYEFEYASVEEYARTYASPEPSMAIVADVASDPEHGLCLEEAVGGPSLIYVVFPIDGELHVACGGVYTQYQFTKPLSERMTDDEWKKVCEGYYDDNLLYVQPNCPDQPEWTRSYRVGEN